MQVLHINLDQPPISQADLVQVQTAASSLTVQTSKPQVTMEKLPDRYHIEVKHEGSTQSHVPPPPHLLSEGGVIYKPMQSELSLHPNVLQISTSAAQVNTVQSTIKCILIICVYLHAESQGNGQHNARLCAGTRRQ